MLYNNIRYSYFSIYRIIHICKGLAEMQPPETYTAHIDRCKYEYEWAPN
jgi:hypothetical protein